MHQPHARRLERPLPRTQAGPRALRLTLVAAAALGTAVAPTTPIDAAPGLMVAEGSLDLLTHGANVDAMLFPAGLGGPTTPVDAAAGLMLAEGGLALLMHGANVDATLWEPTTLFDAAAGLMVPEGGLALLTHGANVDAVPFTAGLQAAFARWRTCETLE